MPQPTISIICCNMTVAYEGKGITLFMKKTILVDTLGKLQTFINGYSLGDREKTAIKQVLEFK